MAEGDPPVVPPTPPAATWFDGLAPDLKDYVTKNGLADKDPVAAFQAAAVDRGIIIHHS